METAPVKETKAQKVERLKREKNPWECLDEIRQFARNGFESIPPEWMTYFRWWGVYTQGDGLGVTGGKGGEGNAVPYLMLRIRIPSGKLHSHQLRAIADITERHARGVADITVRQNIQLHWVTIEDLPGILETLWRHGLNTVGACGDVTRNVTGCPLSGVDADEICDASPLAEEIGRMLAGNSDFYNFPRKYKISASGCRVWCSYPEINDVGLTAVTRDRLGTPEVGYHLRVGGGLSTEPHLAVKLDAFIQQHQVLPVVTAVSKIFRDADVLRTKRERARLKYLFMDHGWSAESFRSEVERHLGYRLDPGVWEEVPSDVYRDHVGIHPQKQAGYFYVGASVVRGRITPDQMRQAAELADRYASGELRATIMQNLVLVNIPEANVPAVVQGLNAAGLPVQASAFHRGIIACTGTEFCKLAISETKGFSRWLADQLDDRLPGFEEHLKIHVTGCPNSCGQHWIADIGLEGKKIKVDGKMVDAFYFFLGGAVGEFAGFGRKTGYRCPAGEVPAAIERLLQGFHANRGSSENLRQFFARHDEPSLRALLAGGEVIPVSREAATASASPAPVAV